MTVKGLTTPKHWLRVAIVLCRYEGLVRGLLLDWYLGSQKLREILTLLCCIILSSSGNPTQCSRGSKKNFWRRCRGGSRKQVNHTKYPSQSLSLGLHYLPFSSRFPLPHFTLAVLFALSFPISSSLSCLSFSCCLFVCSCVSLLACCYVWNWGSYCRHGR